MRKKEVDWLFSSFKRNDLLEDRSEYDEEDLKLAYPQLNEKGVKLLYLKIQKWKYFKIKKEPLRALSNPHRYFFDARL